MKAHATSASKPPWPAEVVAESEGNRERVAEEEVDDKGELAELIAAVAGSCLLVLFYACEALWKTAFQQQHRLLHRGRTLKCLGGFIFSGHSVARDTNSTSMPPWDKLSSLYYESSPEISQPWPPPIPWSFSPSPVPGPSKIVISWPALDNPSPSHR
uniref:Uncharacterized protein n=1 Tax=Pipistrellus kuhlii TaxID=59472 RepID=A0A7J8A7W4_PIPKU|nr:hypothetical protein mPipKuh1_008968 [Pipistrellus kuhlii]